MNKNQEEELGERFLVELKALHESGAGLRLELSPAQAWYVLSIMQLALRHPTFQTDNQQQAAAVRAIAGDIESRLCNGRPAMAEMARLGWDSAFDVPAYADDHPHHKQGSK